jgi:hypothetical protein
MVLKKHTFLLAILFFYLHVNGRQYIQPKTTTYKSSFAIFTDSVTFRLCKSELLSYKAVIENDGLPAFIIADNWKNPEQVRNEIKKLFKTAKLEGVVFIGDIPVAMIRKAQHLTSAFKMSEKSPIFESSVPSDRFYDDLDLKFDFLRQDSVRSLFFYYNLSPQSPQHIQSDIYSARIKPVDNGTDKYLQIRNYLTKAVRLHTDTNPLDQFVSYTGEGSFSNSLSAWESEPYTIREQFPGVFDKNGSARFLRFSQEEFTKNIIINQLRRHDLDLMIFHEHGTPDRQYISGAYPTTTIDDHIREMKADLRSNLRSKRYAASSIPERIKKNIDKYQIDSTWFSGYNNSRITQDDSLTDIKRGIVLSDVNHIAPNARFVIFDACYNGDFREDDYIAGRYIFSDGDCVATFGNSVNVLQDKSANDLLGLLGSGARIGQWAQYVNILESHITGDPTYRFAPNIAEIDTDIFSNLALSDNQLLKTFKSSSYTDIRNLALIRLYRNNYKEISELLKQTFFTSEFATERYNCMHILEDINDSNYREVLKKASTDPNEYIRRIAVHRMGKVGLPEFIPYIVRSYYENKESERVVFNVLISLALFDEADVRKAVSDYLNQSDVYTDKTSAANDFLQKIKFSLNNELDATILDKKATEKNRLFWTSVLKNNNIHPSVEKYLSIVKDENEPESVRISLLESLAWFRLSYKNQLIQDVCKLLANSATTPQSIKAEAERTLNQLTN